MNTYKRRTATVDIGAFSFAFQVQEDGSFTGTLVAVTREGGIETVCHLQGSTNEKEPAVFQVADAYDATNTLGIAAGGGRPTYPENG